VLGVAVVLLSGISPFLAERRPEGSAVSLSFVGFTNEPITVTPVVPGGPLVFSALPQAILLAKNNGSVAVELGGWITSEYLVPIGGVTQFKDDFYPPNGSGLPRILKSGESMTVRVRATNCKKPWRTEFGYQRHGFRERFYLWFWSSAKPGWCGLLNRVMSAPEIAASRFGPCTNMPPSQEDPFSSVNEIADRQPILDAADAKNRAVKIANRLARSRFLTAPFGQKPSEATFDGRHWIWHECVAHGHGDLETFVRLNPDGSVMELNVTPLNSEIAPNPFFRP
jgi:hypothetical protein